MAGIATRACVRRHRAGRLYGRAHRFCRKNQRVYREIVRINGLLPIYKKLRRAYFADPLPLANGIKCAGRSGKALSVVRPIQIDARRPSRCRRSRVSLPQRRVAAIRGIGIRKRCARYLRKYCAEPSSYRPFRGGPGRRQPVQPGRFLQSGEIMASSFRMPSISPATVATLPLLYRKLNNRRPGAGDAARSSAQDCRFPLVT